jgi:hypothetical protein
MCQIIAAGNYLARFVICRSANSLTAAGPVNPRGFLRSKKPHDGTTRDFAEGKIAPLGARQGLQRKSFFTAKR